MKNRYLSNMPKGGYRYAGNVVRSLNSELVVDVFESERRYQITAEVPGVQQGDLSVHIYQGLLSIKGFKRQPACPAVHFHFAERRYGLFERCFLLPQEADVAGIDFQFSQGLLTITLPKSSEVLGAAAIGQNAYLLNVRPGNRPSLQ